MDQRDVAIGMSRARTVVGLVSLALPGAASRLLFGGGASTPRSRALTRMMGVRDVAVGIGALTSVKERTQGPEWLSMGALADGVDALVALTTRHAPRRTRIVALVAAASAVVGMKIARDLADEREAERLAELELLEANA
jgi:hypothetical protein